MNTICRRCKKDFLIDENDQTFYQKMNVPNPTECPDCRFMCRAMWRNETSLYTRSCDACNKSMISMYNPLLPYVVYCNDCYKSDTWDPRDFALEYDLTTPFFKQLDSLFQKVPKNGLGISTGDGQNTNTEYANMISGCKNCYLIFNTSPAEELLYSRGVRNGKYSSDIYFGVDFENCYECVNVFKSSGVYFSRNIQSCVNSYFLLNCSNLIDCFGCVNLRNKSNCWFNEQLTKEEYDTRIQEVITSYKEIQKYKKRFKDFILTFPHRESHNNNTVNCVGDYLTECKNVTHSFEVTKSEDSKYLFASKVVKDSIGTVGYGTNSEKLLEVVATGYSSTIVGSYWAENCHNVYYSFEPRNSESIFGCDSLKKAQYCILNKQYSKEEYEKIKKHIIEELTRNGDYGLMLPPELSPFGYNETIGQDNMPLTEEEVITRGLKWQHDTQKTVGKGTLSVEEIPDNINDISDDIVKEILTCTACARNYKITEQELFFYKRMKLPIPRKCFFCRHHDRIEKRGPYQFWNRNCALCKKDIVTNYAPERPEIVYCEDCYKREVL